HVRRLLRAACRGIGLHWACSVPRFPDFESLGMPGNRTGTPYARVFRQGRPFPTKANPSRGGGAKPRVRQVPDGRATEEGAVVPGDTLVFREKGDHHVFRNWFARSPPPRPAPRRTGIAAAASHAVGRAF